MLLGCATPEEEHAYRQQAEEAQKQQAEKKLQVLENSCLRYGHTRGTFAYAECIQNEETREVANSSKASCLENARERLCYVGCLGYKNGGEISACNQNCNDRERVNAAACHGIFIPPAARNQIIIQQGSGDTNPFPNINKCISKGGVLKC